jgi:hypothetical protein
MLIANISVYCDGLLLKARYEVHGERGINFRNVQITNIRPQRKAALLISVETHKRSRKSP